MDKKQIARELVKIAKQLSASEHGFDLTDIKARDFISVLKSVGINPDKVQWRKSGYEWKGSGILVVTGNNPITGEYMSPDRKDDKVDSAGYIGIEGDEDKVQKVAEGIRTKAIGIKDESPGEREYI